MPGDGVAGRTIGGFRVIEPLGSGAHATVYRARQVRLDRDVALKILHASFLHHDESTRRFEREGIAAAGLDHPCIVPVYAAGEDGGVFYLAMRLVPGTTLAEELRAGPVSRERTATVLERVGSALDHAHQRGVLHRDVKPSNILVEDEAVLLADFGVAATLRTAGDGTVGPLGTARYMAPEQARGSALDGRSDLYALACVAYECVTGRAPFDGGDVVALLYAHAHQPVPSCGDPALDRFFRKGLAKEPGQRFASGAEMTAAFREAATGSSPSRRPALLAVGAVVAAAALVAGVGVLTGGSSGDDDDVTTTTASASESVAPTVVTSVGTPVVPVTTAIPVRGVAPSGGVTGPVTIVDPGGVRYDLPAGWSVRSHLDQAGGAQTDLERSGVFVARLELLLAYEYTVEELADLSLFEVLGTPSQPCPASGRYVPAAGERDAVFCRAVGPDGVGHRFVFVSQPKQVWVVQIDETAPTSEIDAFVASMQFE